MILSRSTVIIALLCLALFKLGASVPLFTSEYFRHGDDRKGKRSKDDTTRTVANREEDCEEETGEIPDTMQVAFPSHDLYSTWDVSAAHPYNFYESFKEDSVVITLVNEIDSAFVLPFKGTLTSVFGWRKYRPHYGTDIDLNRGDSVCAAFDGMVRIAKYFKGYGNCVIVRHNNGLETVYAHLSKILVESGQTLYAGQLVGLGGNTGRSRGSHLHFEIRYLGQALDTQDFIDFESGELKSNTFTLKKCDVENKYDLRALHRRHLADINYTRKHGLALNGVYYIRKGDTLSGIAKRNGVSVSTICKKNKISRNSVLRIGQKLKM